MERASRSDQQGSSVKRKGLPSLAYHRRSNLGTTFQKESFTLGLRDIAQRYSMCFTTQDPELLPQNDHACAWVPTYSKIYSHHRMILREETSTMISTRACTLRKLYEH